MSDPAVEAAQRADEDNDGWSWDTTRVAMIEAAREALKPIRELHKPMHGVFSWSEGLRMFDPCPDCGGKAGVHPCGCWGDSDVEFCCPTCRDEKGRHTDWPCATARLVYTAEERFSPHTRKERQRMSGEDEVNRGTYAEGGSVSTPSLASRIAQTLRQHEYNGAEDQRPHYRHVEFCICGWRSTFEHRTHTDHVADLLVALFGADEQCASLVAEVEKLRTELAFARDGMDIRPMTEVESNLMTQVLDLRRQLAAAERRAL